MYSSLISTYKSNTFNLVFGSKTFILEKMQLKNRNKINKLREKLNY